MFFPDVKNEIQLWHFPFATLALWNIQRYLDVPAGEYLPLLPASSHARVLRYRQNADRERTLLAEILIRHMLSEALGSAPDTFVILREENGKPYLAGGKTAITLSHAANWCATAVSTRPVGVDVETNAVSEEIAVRFFATGEATSDLSERLRLWTLKEAYCKCRGVPLEEALLVPAAAFPALGLSTFSEKLPNGWLSLVTET